MFIQLSTQWRVGFSAPTGLDYTALPAVLGILAIPRKQWPDLFEGIRTMEDAALKTMHKGK